MALTATLVEATPKRLRYLLTNVSPASTSVTLPNDAGATPDLRTDCVTGLGTTKSSQGARGLCLLDIMQARINGIGPIAAGTALNQAQARAILLSDDAASAVLTNYNVPRAIATVAARTNGRNWSVDANVDGQGDPVLVVTVSSAVANDAAYLDIFMRDTRDEG